MGITHGMSKSREFCAWHSAKTRCYNPKYHGYRNYGGRGIAMADEWRHDFKRFMADMGPCPPGHSLDRFPDRNGPYAPGNCRWATSTQQTRNSRQNRLLTRNGETLPLSEWAERLGMGKTTLDERLSRGWTQDRAFTETVHKKRPELSTAAVAHGLQPETVRARLRRGWPEKLALTTPAHYRGR